MDEGLQRSTPDNGDALFEDNGELLAPDVQERPAKQARVQAEAVSKVLPASKRPSILRSVVKGVPHFTLRRSPRAWIASKAHDAYALRRDVIACQLYRDFQASFAHALGACMTQSRLHMPCSLRQAQSSKLCAAMADTSAAVSGWQRFCGRHRQAAHPDQCSRGQPSHHNPRQTTWPPQEVESFLAV